MASRWVLRCCSCQTPGQSNERPSRVFPARAREHGGSKRTNKLVRDKVINRVYAGDNDDWLMGSGCHIRRGWEDEFVPSAFLLVLFSSFHHLSLVLVAHPTSTIHAFPSPCKSRRPFFRKKTLVSCFFFSSLHTPSSSLFVHSYSMANNISKTTPPLAGRPPFATDEPDSVYANSPSTQTRQLRQPRPQDNRPDSTYAV